MRGANKSHQFPIPLTEQSILRCFLRTVRVHSHCHIPRGVRLLFNSIIYCIASVLAVARAVEALHESGHGVLGFAQKADSASISQRRGVGGGSEAREAFVTILAMLKSLDLTNRIRSQVDKTFARIAASVDLLVGI